MLAHVAGIPVEETLMAVPGLVAAGGAWLATVRARAAARRPRDPGTPGHDLGTPEQPPDAVGQHLEEQPQAVDRLGRRQAGRRG